MLGVREGRGESNPISFLGLLSASPRWGPKLARWPNGKTLNGSFKSFGWTRLSVLAVSTKTPHWGKGAEGGGSWTPSELSCSLPVTGGRVGHREGKVGLPLTGGDSRAGAIKIA